MPAAEVRHLCGHLPLHPTPQTPTTFCIKCAAWGCTTANCPGHMAHPGEVPPGERLLGSQDPSTMTDAQRRAYFDRVAPSVNVMRDILGLDDQA